MPAASLLPASQDAFLGGRVTAVQPLAGHHRAGLDAVLLAAAVDTAFAGMVFDLGAGAGIAGLAVAARCPQARVTSAERDPEAAGCAAAALALPQNQAFASRVSVAETDIFDVRAREAAGLQPSSADAVIMNPPFHEPAAGTLPPAASRAAAYVLENGIDPWLRAAASLLRPRGQVNVIFRADRLEALLAAASGRFGGAAVLPIAPRANVPATRVILAAWKGGRGPLRLLPPLVLHGEKGNAYLLEAGPTRFSRSGASLADVHPAWAGVS